MGVRVRVRALAAVGAALFLSVASSASAQVPAGTSPQLRSQYDTLFQRILADPANLDANFQFAEIATQLGDLEAAIGALERIIFYNPNLPRVRLELGILYFSASAPTRWRSNISSRPSPAPTCPPR